MNRSLSQKSARNFPCPGLLCRYYSKKAWTSRRKNTSTNWSLKPAGKWYAKESIPSARSPSCLDLTPFIISPGHSRKNSGWLQANIPKCFLNLNISCPDSKKKFLPYINNPQQSGKYTLLRVYSFYLIFMNRPGPESQTVKSGWPCFWPLPHSPFPPLFPRNNNKDQSDNSHNHCQSDTGPADYFPVNIHSLSPSASCECGGTFLLKQKLKLNSVFFRIVFMSRQFKPDDIFFTCLDQRLRHIQRWIKCCHCHRTFDQHRKVGSCQHLDRLIGTRNFAFHRAFKRRASCQIGKNKNAVAVF